MHHQACRPVPRSTSLCWFKIRFPAKIKTRVGNKTQRNQQKCTSIAFWSTYNSSDMTWLTVSWIYVWQMQVTNRATEEAGANSVINGHRLTELLADPLENRVHCKVLTGCGWHGVDSSYEPLLSTAMHSSFACVHCCLRLMISLSSPDPVTALSVKTISKCLREHDVQNIPGQACRKGHA